MSENTEIKTYSDRVDYSDDSSLKQTCSLCSEHTNCITKTTQGDE